METIVEYTEGRQNTADLLIVQEINGVKLETRVHVDSSYSDQSSAVISVWADDLSWHRITHVASQKVSSGTFSRKERDAKDVAQVLLDRAVEILELV